MDVVAFIRKLGRVITCVDCAFYAKHGNGLGHCKVEGYLENQILPEDFYCQTHGRRKQ